MLSVITCWCEWVLRCAPVQVEPIDSHRAGSSNAASAALDAQSDRMQQGGTGMLAAIFKSRMRISASWIEIPVAPAQHRSKTSMGPSKAIHLYRSRLMTQAAVS